MQTILIAKEDGIWKATFGIMKNQGKFLRTDDVITAKNYSELMVEVANKGWIDTLNKI